MTGKANMTIKPRRSKTLFLVVVFVMVASLAGVVLLANNARNLERLRIALGFDPVARPLPEQGPVPIARPPAPIIPVPERMLDVPAMAPQEGFHRTITRGREDICSALQKSGWISEEWQFAYVGERGWSCGAEKIVIGAGEADLPAGTLFVSARGTDSDSVSSVRLKINFLDGQLSGPVLEQAVSAADAILEAIGWGDEPALIASLRRLEEFEINGNGHTVSLFQEPSDIPRYNFLISSDPPGFADKDVVSPARKKWLRSPSPGN